MCQNHLDPFRLLLALGILGGCTRSVPPAQPVGPAGSNQAPQETASSGTSVVPEVAFHPLQQPELEQFLAVWPQLQQADPYLATVVTPGNAAAVRDLQSWKMSEATRDLLTSQQLTPEQFKELAAKVLAAAAAAQAESIRNTFQATQKAATQNKSDQEKASVAGFLGQQLTGIMQSYVQFEKVPPGNVELVKKHWRELTGKQLPDLPAAESPPGAATTPAEADPGSQE